MRRDAYVRLVDARPKGIEHGICWRSTVDRAGADVDQRRAPLDHPLELLDGQVEIQERDEGWGEDPALIREARLLLEPAIERMQIRRSRRRIVLQEVLDRHRQ